MSKCDFAEFVLLFFVFLAFFVKCVMSDLSWCVLQLVIYVICCVAIFSSSWQSSCLFCNYIMSSTRVLQKSMTHGWVAMHRWVENPGMVKLRRYLLQVFPERYRWREVSEAQAVHAEKNGGLLADYWLPSQVRSSPVLCVWLMFWGIKS